MRTLRTIALAAVLGAGSPSWAAGPEQLEQLEPDRGEWQLEYYGVVAHGGEDAHSLQVLYGLGDRLALGLEIETAWTDGAPELEGFAPTALLRLTDAEEDPVGIGFAAQAELDGDFDLASLEGRLILEKRTPAWWAQGNVMLRHEREAGGWGSELAYGWAVSRGLAEGLWLGIEGSGQAESDGGHFIGPAITVEREPARGPEVEIGLAYQRRIGGEGPDDSVRMFVQFTL